MSDTHVIGWDVTHNSKKYKLWYAGIKNSQNTKSMRTQASPEIVIQRSAFITDAVKFDTFVEAYDVYNGAKIRRGGKAYIRYFTAQEIFKIILEGG